MILLCHPEPFSIWTFHIRVKPNYYVGTLNEKIFSALLVGTRSQV